MLDADRLRVGIARVTARRELVAAVSHDLRTPHAARADARIVGPHGAPAWVSFVRAPPAVQLAFDDLAVQRARRQVLADPPSALVATVLTDASHFEGALTAWRDGAVHEDPCARIFPARCLQVGKGLLGNINIAARADR